MKIECRKSVFVLILWLVLCSPPLLAEASTVQSWVQRYNKQTGSDDTAQKVAADPDGNVIVAGYSVDRINADKMLVIKYSSSGVAMWTNCYSGPAKTNTYAQALAVDGFGNVFMAGHTSGLFSGLDYVVLKYSPMGLALWTNIYNGPGNSDDHLTAIGIDGSGNVIVTGYSWGTPGTGLEFATIAYSSAGSALWTNRYGGPSAGPDYAYALAVGNNGSVFVTGGSRTPAGNNECATIGYSHEGLPMWTNRFATENAGDSTGLGVAVDSNGSVFVTGTATIKYSNTGVPVWTNATAQGKAIAVDRNGSAIITGYGTIAYSGNGVARWANGDSASALAVDTNGNVFVTGTRGLGGFAYVYETSKYSPTGIPVWTRAYSGTATNDFSMSVAISGDNVFVTGYSRAGEDSDFATVSYSSAGVSMWTNRYNGGPGNYDDQATAIAVGPSGGVFVTGNSGYEFATVAYSSSGSPIWTNYYNAGRPEYEHYARALAVDTNGNVFVAGYSRGFSFFDYVTLKYSASGLILWTNRYDGTRNQNDYAQDMKVDPAGNIIVTGYSYGTNGYNYVTVAYANSGMPIWTNRWLDRNSYGKSIAADKNGNLFVTGYSEGNLGYYDYATIAYSTAGVALWTNRFDGTFHLDDYAQAVAVDNNGNVFVTGYSHGNDQYDYATVAYSTTGTALWTNRYTGPRAFGDDRANALVVDGGGVVYVTGSSQDITTGSSFATVAYSSAGTPLWTNRYKGPGGGFDVASSIVTDNSGHIFVAGHSRGTGSGYDLVMVVYLTNGIPLCTNRYNGPANGDDQLQTKASLAIAADGVLLLGSSDGDFTARTAYDYATIKYTFSPYDLLLGTPRLDSTSISVPGSGSPNTTWVLQRAQGPGGPWQSIGNMILAPDGKGQLEDTNIPSGSAYYRGLLP